ncbi:universal stress protein [Arthrobacter sp. TMN-50]
MQSVSDRQPIRLHPRHTVPIPSILDEGALRTTSDWRPHRIVVGVNGSPESIEALLYAQQIAAARSIHVDAVTAWTTDTPMLDYGDPGGDPEEEARTALRLAAASAFGEILPAHLHLIVKEGEATDVLIAESSQADLLIIGCRGRRRMSRTLFGSVSVECAERAHCPVLVRH